MFSSASQPEGEIASQPAAITSTRAVLPDPRAPMIATRQGLSGIGRGSPVRTVDPDVRDDLRRCYRSRRQLTDIGAALRVDARLTEGIEFERPLDPRISVVDGLAHGFLIVGIASMKAGLATIISHAQLFYSCALVAEPELSLNGAAREDNVGELLDFLAHCDIGGMPDARCSVSGATGNGD
jgi:hypothetical protein